MTGRGSLAKRSPLPVWSDGLHYVRRTAETDNHPMAWFAGAHRVTASTLRRYAETMDEALLLAKDATRRWVKDHPADRKLVKAAPLPRDSMLEGVKRGKPGRPPKVKLEGFSTYHFTCIAANPYAQVWQCTSYPGEKKAVGRKKAGGREADQTPFRHQKGECSVLIGDEPVRNSDGTIRVYPNWIAADEAALELYHAAPEDDVISWKPGDIVVWRTENFNVEFDVAVNGRTKPFSLFNVKFNKPVYLDKTRPAILSDSQATRYIRPLQETNPEAYLQITEARAKARQIDRVPSFSTEPAKCRSITEAIREAERREKMLRGEPV